MRKEPKRKTSTFSGYVIFFVTVVAIVWSALSVFVAVNRKTEGNPTAIAVTMFVTIVVSSLLCTVADIIRRKIMIDKPVRKILQATERIAAGDFSTRLTVSHAYEKYDDYDLIMENLNLMAAELEKSEILKTDFIANVSHEIKTPLAIITAYVSMLEKDGLDDETRKKYAAVAAQAARRLNDLISNILKLNKLENSGLTLETGKFRLDESIAECVLQYEEVFSQKGLELTCDLDETTVVSSKSTLELVWNNLLSNAVKFTERGGKIGVSLKIENGNAVVRVSDTGCGISAETGARIFDKFYQGDTSRSGEGNGLGLALVKKVIDVLGGEIFVKSEVGKGSEFTVVLKGQVCDER